MAKSTIRPIIAPLVVCLICALGCVQRTRIVDPVPSPVPFRTAADIVDRNIAMVDGTLRASGSVDGRFTTEGGRRVSYSASGVLFYLAPRHIRFDLKKLGDRQFLFGSNDDAHWTYSREEDRFYCGRHDLREEWPSGMPVRPDQIPASLCLTPILVLCLTLCELFHRFGK